MPNHVKLSVAIVIGQIAGAVSQCLSNESLNAEFARIITGDDSATSYSIEGSCCQETICGLGCPEEVDPPAEGEWKKAVVKVVFEMK
mmetsp:Transcript_4985/g.9494  ORF Transcript_4985/g.9494 Transcript_4985/m.9494 type:complete len:87 (+) Transcript_4985:178-438(+)